jgi:hypothetical protein
MDVRTADEIERGIAKELGKSERKAVARALRGEAGEAIVVRFGKHSPLSPGLVADALRRVEALAGEMAAARQEARIAALLEAVLTPPEAASETQRLLALDNAALRKRFLDTIPCLSSAEVGRLAGSAAKNAAATASRWKAERRVFAVPALGQDRYPAFQFRDGAPHPAVARALAALPPGKAPWPVAFWFVTGNGWLGGAAPMDRLDDADAVAGAAAREAETPAG